MLKRMPVREHVSAVLIGLGIALILGYFHALREGDVRGFVFGLILTPTVVWAFTVFQWRFRMKRKDSSAESKNRTG